MKTAVTKHNRFSNRITVYRILSILINNRVLDDSTPTQTRRRSKQVIQVVNLTHAGAAARATTVVVPAINPIAFFEFLKEEKTMLLRASVK
jgi:hypothetical protein